MQTDDTALWRFQVIAPLLSLDAGRGRLKAEIERLAERDHDHSRRGPVRLSFATIEEWYYRYRHEGLDALRQNHRADRGRSRKIDARLAEAIEAIAKGHPDLDGPGILAELVAQDLPTVSLSTLYRFLRSRGLDRRKRPATIDHRAYAFALPGDCWQIDVMYAPALTQKDGTQRKTYLIAILDDCSRLVPHAQFYYEQHLLIFKDCLKQAFLKRGLPRRIYFDNGKIFRSRIIHALAARLGIQSIHSRPYQPQGRAKLERWFLTVRQSFLPRLDLPRLDLDGMNRLLWGWIEGEYHVRPHHGLEGMSAMERWMGPESSIRPLPLDVDLEQLFLDSTVRRVCKDGTLTIAGKRYEAGPDWIGRKVVIRFNPYDLRQVYLEPQNGALLPLFLVDLVGNCHVRRNRADPMPSAPKPPLRSLDLLRQRTQEDRHD
jgi:transposase InsO family protein